MHLLHLPAELLLQALDLRVCATQLVLAAHLINANFGIRVIDTQIDGFDTHSDQAAWHATLLSRLDSTRLGQQAASTGIVKFQVIDPPTPAFKPVSPDRPLLILGSLVLAVAAGLAAAYVLNLLQPVFVSARQLGAVTGFPVLGAVGLAWEAQHRTQQRRGRFLYASAFSGLVLLAIGVLLLHTHISKLVGELLA